MASTARNTVGTKFYHVACTNKSIVTAQLVKILRSKVTWIEIKFLPVFPAYYYSTLISKRHKVFLKLTWPHALYSC